MRRVRFVLGLSAGAFLALARLVPAAGAPAQKAPPGWPLDAPPVLTSSFGEYRANHLHAGIDLGTGGRTGLPCHAVGDGSVVRMRMSPFGYGKALYIQLEGGTLTVYAHLSRFAEPMASRARAEQKRNERYTFDIQIPPGTMPVRRGEVIAWSGQTGVGVPHLHFEMRQGDVAIDPQRQGFAVVDTIAPVIEELVAMPLDVRSHVAGAWDVHRLAAGEDAPPLAVAGRIGFGVRAWDAATSRAYPVGPDRLALSIDGVAVFARLQARFDYADNHLAVLEYDQERLQEGGDRVHLLYLRPGDRLPGRSAARGREGVLFAPVDRDTTGEMCFAAGVHTLEVEVSDVAGHTTRRRARVQAAPWAPEVPEETAPSTAAGPPLRYTWMAPAWHSRFVAVDARSSRPAPCYAASRDAPDAELVAERLGRQAFRIGIAIADAHGVVDIGPTPHPTGFGIELRAHGVRAGEAARIADLDPAVGVEIPARVLLEDVAVRIERVPAQRLQPNAELLPAGPCVLVEPRTAALDAPIGIALRDSGATRSDRVGLFWVNRGGELRFLSAERDSAGRLRARTSFLSFFGAFADTTPPRIGALRVVPRGKRTQQLVFTVRDAGAELGDGGIVTRLDGAVAIPEWDPETGQVVVEPEARLRRGAHRLEVVATDQLGNRARRSLRFEVQ